MWGRVAYIWRAGQQGLLVLSLQQQWMHLMRYMAIFLFTLPVIGNVPDGSFSYWPSMLQLKSHFSDILVDSSWEATIINTVFRILKSDESPVYKFGLVQPWRRKRGKYWQIAKSDHDPCLVWKKRLAPPGHHEGSSRRPRLILCNMALALLSTTLSSVHRASSVAI